MRLNLEFIYIYIFMLNSIQYSISFLILVLDSDKLDMAADRWRCRWCYFRPTPDSIENVSRGADARNSITRSRTKIAREISHGREGCKRTDCVAPNPRSRLCACHRTDSSTVGRVPRAEIREEELARSGRQMAPGSGGCSGYAWR